MTNNQSPKKRSTHYPQSTGFIRDTSPNRFRQTIMSTGFIQLPSINRLRHSFSSSTIQVFDQLCEKSKREKQDCRQETFDKLRDTLSQLEEKIRRVNCSMVRRNFVRKNVSASSEQFQPQLKQDKNRQTISTAVTTTISHKKFHIPQSKPQTSYFITSQPKPANFHPFLINPYNKTNNHYYISQALRAANEKNSLAIEHINGSIKMIQSCQQFVDEKLLPKSVKGFEMKRLERDFGKKTLVLDLDETLIHCYENLEMETDLVLSMTIDGTKVKVGVNIRPYVMTFLKRMARKYEIVIFTASHESYANAILDELDPQNTIFSHRFYRPHCTILPNELHVKDLRHMKRDLKDVVLVDNAAYSYAFQLQNGIPVLPYYEGKDFQLQALQKYLDELAECEDVRVVNREYFRLGEYKRFENAEEIIKELYQQRCESKV